LNWESDTDRLLGSKRVCSAESIGGIACFSMADACPTISFHDKNQGHVWARLSFYIKIGLLLLRDAELSLYKRGFTITFIL
jgi:hypothetical protein